KPCFVCGSLSHLIKDCDYYEKKIAREAALKSKRVFHADVKQATPAWTNANRVNKANQFTPKHVQLSNIRPNHSTVSITVKTGRENVNTGKQHVNSGSVHVNYGTQIKSGASSFKTGKQQINSGRVNRPGTAVKYLSRSTSRPKPYDWPGFPKRQLISFYCNWFTPLKHMEHRVMVVSVICDKKLNILFTEKECFVVSSDFKMPDENQVLLKVPRQHNMYTFDMKNVVSSKAYTCLLAKASSDEAKLWHRSQLGKFVGSLIEGFLVGYSVNRTDGGLFILQRKAAFSENICYPKRLTPQSSHLLTNIQQVTPGNMEAISPSANHVEEVFSDADDDEMPEIRIYDKSSEGIFEQASFDDDGIITDFNNLPDEEELLQFKTSTKYAWVLVDLPMVAIRESALDLDAFSDSDYGGSP
ncbi:hypothetical protein Tco_1267956, partial [Tanacetum coccineum]